MSLTLVTADSVNTSSDFTFTGNLVISGAGGIIVNSNTPIYFANGSTFVFDSLANVVVSYAQVANAAYLAQSITDGASLNATNVSIHGYLEANNTTGNTGQVLTATGNGGIYWANTVLGLPYSNVEGQVLINRNNTAEWHSLYTVSNTAPFSPNYGDIWYYTIDDRQYMWVTDGSSSFWLDYLPYVG